MPYQVQVTNASKANYEKNLAIGNIPNSSVIRKFGNSENIGTSWTQVAPEPIVPGSASVVSVISSDANDTAITGSGARVLVLVGLAADWTPLTAEISLNGVSAVTTVETFAWVNTAYIKLGEAGESETNEGKIIGTISGGVAFVIPIGDSRTQQAIYAVPAGKIFLGKQVQFWIDSSKSTDVRMVARFDADSTNSVKMVLGKIFAAKDSPPIWEPNYLSQIPAKTVLYIEAEAAGGSTKVSAEITGELINA